MNEDLISGGLRSLMPGLVAMRSLKDLSLYCCRVAPNSTAVATHASAAKHLSALKSLNIADFDHTLTTVPWPANAQSRLKDAFGPSVDITLEMDRDSVTVSRF